MKKQTVINALEAKIQAADREAQIRANEMMFAIFQGSKAAQFATAAVAVANERRDELIRLLRTQCSSL